MTPTQLYGWDEAAEKLAVRSSWLRDKVKRREIPHVRLGRHVRFTEEDLAAIVEMGRTPIERAQQELASQPSVSIPTPLPKRRPRVVAA